MRTGLIAIGMIAMIAASTNMAMAGTIVIDDGYNLVTYTNFNINDPWKITLTGANTYQVSGSINGNPYHVFFLGVYGPVLANNYCVPEGSYQVAASGGSGNNAITVNGQIIVSQQEANCTPIAPIPELDTVVLVSAGLIGMLLVARKYKN